MWHVYMVECSDRSLYTGITTHIENRIRTHNTSPQGAKYVRSRRPVKLVYSREVGNRSAALKEESRIRKLPRKEKFRMLQLT